MKNEVMEQRFNGIEGLPTLPLVLQQLQKVINNPRSNMSQIAVVVAKDQALASRSIRLVNSAFYARTKPVTSIQQAIVTLGLKTLNNLMLGLSVIKMFDSSRQYGYDPNAFWEHSFATALMAKKLVAVTGYDVDAEECFVAGLLHDMGRLVMEQFLHDDFITALQASQSDKKSLLCCEIEVIGFSHADVGAWLGRRWNIPTTLIYAMELHHDPVMVDTMELTGSEKNIVRLVTAANEICITGKIGSSGELIPNTRVCEAMSKMSPAILNRLLEETRGEVNATLHEWRKML